MLPAAWQFTGQHAALLCQITTAQNPGNTLIFESIRDTIYATIKFQVFHNGEVIIESKFLTHIAKALTQFASGNRILLIAGDGQEGLTQAARNLQTVDVVTPDRLNVYDIVRAGAIVISERDVARVKEVWS